VAISLSNTLTAQTLVGGLGPQSAFIEKKFAGVAFTVNGVPTPGTLPLVALAVLALAATRRK
jgi:MYXO-CTERM domain-containing protein